MTECPLVARVLIVLLLDCFELSERERERERVSRENTHRFMTQWAARDAMDESNSMHTP